MQMRLESEYMKRIASSLIKKSVKNKKGIEIELTCNSLEVSNSGEVVPTIHIHCDCDISMSYKDLKKLLNI